MGIYDRDYMRRRPDGSHPFPLKSVLAAAVGVLVLVYVVTQWQKTSRLVQPSRVTARTSMTLGTATPIPRPGKGSLRVNVNTAPASELVTLPGIGPAKAKMIIDRRPYSSPDDLMSRGAVGLKLLDSIRPFVKTAGETERLPASQD